LQSKGPDLAGHYAWIKQHIGETAGRRVLIVGDVGLDEYVLGEVRRISPEAPVPVVEVQREDRRLGLAANVAANVLDLGGEPTLLGVMGRDLASDQLSALMAERGLTGGFFVADPQRPTTKKLRVIAQNQQVVRIDFERRQFLASAIENQLAEQALDRLASHDVLVLQDYAKGVLTETLCQRLIQAARQARKPVLVDPHRSTPLRFYRGADILKPNRDEALQLAGLSADDHTNEEILVRRAGLALREAGQIDTVVMTLGKNGMRLFSSSEMTSIPTFAREVYDVTGAGDTVLAALSLGVAAQWGAEKTCVFGNLAAGVVVGELGCVTCSPQQVLDYMGKISYESERS
jgi:rfaE bifunctional protein kinase chain/domain